MLAAENFFSSQAMLLVVVGLVRWRPSPSAGSCWGRPRGSRRTGDMAARMAAIGRPVPQTTATAADKAGTGWIPESVSSFGERFAQSRGFSEKLDGQLEAGVSLRAGEFVVATVGMGLLGAHPRRRDPPEAAAPGGHGLGAGGGADGPPDQAEQPGRQDAGAAARRPDDHGLVAPGRHSFLQALDTVAREIPAPANVEFQRLVAEIRLGRPAEELEALADRVGSADFRWAVLAVNIQREVGGNLAEILDNVSDTLRERATMRRRIKVLTAEVGSPPGSCASCRSRSRCTCSR